MKEVSEKITVFLTQGYLTILILPACFYVRFQAIFQLKFNLVMKNDER